MKLVYTFILFLSFFTTYSQGQDLSEIRKNIPLRKVKNVQTSPANSSWFQFEFKNGTGLWDSDKGKVILSNPGPIHVFSSCFEGSYLIYTKDSTFIYLAKDERRYGVSINDTLEKVIKDDYYTIDYLKGRSSWFTLRLKDSLGEGYFSVNRTDKDILMDCYADYLKPTPIKQQIIDLTSHNVKISGHEIVRNSFGHGYKAEQDFRFIFYANDYEPLTDTVDFNDLGTLQVIRQVTGCDIDSVIRFIDDEHDNLSRRTLKVFYNCDGFWGQYDIFNGIVFKPEMDMVFASPLFDVCVKDGRLGLLTRAPYYDALFKPQFTHIAGYNLNNCHPTIKLDKKAFDVRFHDCYRDILNSIDPKDSMELVDLPLEERTSLTVIIGNNLIRSYSYARYHEDDRSEWNRGYSHLGNSGIYNLALKKWVVPPNKLAVEPYGNYFLVGEPFFEDVNSFTDREYYFIDQNYTRVNDNVYSGMRYWNKKLLLFDSDRNWYVVDSSDLSIKKIGVLPFLYVKTQVEGDYILINRTLPGYPPYIKNDFRSTYRDHFELFTAYIDKEFKIIIAPEGSSFVRRLSNDFMLISDKKYFQKYEDSKFALYDVLNQEVISEWYDSYEISEDGKIELQGDNKIVYDPKNIER